jgi:hypothetical protein
MSGHIFDAVLWALVILAVLAFAYDIRVDPPAANEAEKWAHFASGRVRVRLWIVVIVVMLLIVMVATSA